MNDIIESCFETLTHKYNVVRKIFWQERSDVLIYQPKTLRHICRKYEFDYIIDAINETVSKRRKNYFKTFVEIIGEEISKEYWKYYSGNINL